MGERSAWPIIVGGCYRSGTSVVRRVLDGHSRIHCGTEVPFFRDVFGEYADDPYAHLRFTAAARSLVGEPEIVELLGAAFVVMHERAATRAGKPRWADKSPDNVMHLDDWSALLGDEWLFVHVVRDPVDTLASMAQVGFPLTLPPSLPERIALYNRYIAAALEFAGRAPERYRLVEYGNLVTHPSATVAGLMTWLGERAEDAQLELARDERGGLEDPRIGGTCRISAARSGRGEAVLGEEVATAVRRETAASWSAALELLREQR